MTVSKRAIVLSLAIALAALSIGLLVARGGLLAWLGSAVGLAMIAKASVRPGDVDLRWTVGGMVAWCALWAIPFGAVHLGWETGEVVVIRPADPATGETYDVRVWVVDDEVSGGPVVFYDASRDRLAAIGKQATLEWVRDGITRRSRPTLHVVDEASPELVARIFGLVEEKYGELDWATNTYFLLAGRAWGRTLGILQLGPVQPESGAPWSVQPQGRSAQGADSAAGERRAFVS